MMYWIRCLLTPAASSIAVCGLYINLILSLICDMNQIPILLNLTPVGLAESFWN
jgi:hypothetical protein